MVESGWNKNLFGDRINHIADGLNMRLEGRELGSSRVGAMVPGGPG